MPRHHADERILRSDNIKYHRKYGPGGNTLAPTTDPRRRSALRRWLRDRWRGAQDCTDPQKIAWNDR